jgi:nicotinamidase-related amidase
MEQVGNKQHSEKERAMSWLFNYNTLTWPQVILVVDHQVGLATVVRDWEPNEFRNNVIAHAALGRLFNIPVILTSSSDQGPNGPLLKEIRDMYPDAPFIRRQGEVNAWDNPDFAAAVRGTGRRQVVMAGIVTEVCKDLHQPCLCGGVSGSNS